MRHVVKLEGGLAVPLFSGAERLNEFPILRPCRERPIPLRRIAAVPLEKERAVGPGDLLASQERGEAPAVELHVLRFRHAAEFQHRGGNVNVRGDAVHPAPRFELRGPADEAKLVDAALVRRALPALKTCIEAVVLLAAVVGEEDDDRVVGQMEFVELRQQTTHVVVDVLDHPVHTGEVLRVVLGRHRMPGVGILGGFEVAVRVMLPVFVRYLVRRVGAIERQVQEERLIGLFLDELDGRVGDNVTDISSGFHPLAVVAERRVEIGPRSSTGSGGSPGCARPPPLRTSVS